MKYIICFFAVLLTACAATPQRVVVTQTQTEVITIPDILLAPCSVSVPPNKEEYPDLTFPQKETILTDYINRLVTDMRNCNARVKDIKAYQERRLNEIRRKKP